MISSRTCAYHPDCFTREICLNMACDQDCNACPLSICSMLAIREEALVTAIREVCEKADQTRGARIVLFGGDPLKKTGIVDAAIRACDVCSMDRRTTVLVEVCLPQLTKECIQWLVARRDQLVPSVEVRAEWLNADGWAALEALQPFAVIRYGVTPEGAEAFAQAVSALDQKGFLLEALYMPGGEWSAKSLAALSQGLAALARDPALHARTGDRLFDPFPLKMLTEEQATYELGCHALELMDCVGADGMRYGCRQVSLYAKTATELTPGTVNRSAGCAQRGICRIGSVCNACEANTPLRDVLPDGGTLCKLQQSQLAASALYHLHRGDMNRGTVLRAINILKKEWVAP